MRPLSYPGVLTVTPIEPARWALRREEVTAVQAAGETLRAGRSPGYAAGCGGPGGGGRPGSWDGLLIDGSSMIFRAFYGVPASVSGPDGQPNNAVRGFLDALARLVVQRRPRQLAVASDEAWRPAWRVALIPAYKAQRVAEDVIATWSALAAGTVLVLSGDRDLFGLVEDPRVSVLYPEKGGMTVVDEAEGTRRYGVPARRHP